MAQGTIDSLEETCTWFTKKNHDEITTHHLIIKLGSEIKPLLKLINELVTEKMKPHLEELARIVNIFARLNREYLTTKTEYLTSKKGEYDTEYKERIDNIGKIILGHYADESKKIAIRLDLISEDLRRFRKVR